MQYAIAPRDHVPGNGERIIERGRVMSGYSEVDIDAGVEFDLIHAGADTAPLNGEHHESEHHIMREEEEAIEPEEDRLRFQVSTTQDEDEIWMTLLGRPSLQGWRVLLLNLKMTMRRVKGIGAQEVLLESKRSEMIRSHPPPAIRALRQLRLVLKIRPFPSLRPHPPVGLTTVIVSEG